MSEANNTVSQLTNKLNDDQSKLNGATNKNEALQKELDAALQFAKATQVHAEEVLNQNN
ncbi:hypothetical protein [Leuconostoc mesenteroides]|uniref:hypothetical protein n=1 Tax=Leuconostoc mesenteroides TaxID=1245 RepID=UPI001301C3E1|nr:hypothetical protein [Leuconostoc mesenteroides]MCP9302475.1 hypothetical protein [Leuconostoc mesenteroides]MCP9326818.1 hypothetical protein [Leuconostoc mesenteroides]